MTDFLDEGTKGSVIKWRDEYNVGVKIIDDQHKHFIGILRRLYNSLVNDDKSSYQEILLDLKNYTNHHFQTEELYFKEFKYPYAEPHKAAHNQIKAKVATFTDKEGNLLGDGFELLAVLEDWLVNHLETMDRKFAGLFHENGLH